MTSATNLARYQEMARRRVMLDTAGVGLPIIMAFATLAWRLSGVWALMITSLAALVLLALVAMKRAHAFDQAWLIAALDAKVPALEDSSALLFTGPEALGGLATLQRNRLQARIAEVDAPDLRPAWSLRAIAWTAGIGSAAILATVLWPSIARHGSSSQELKGPLSRLAAPRVQSVRLRITPPAYTGLPASEQTSLDARIPEGSHLGWVIAITSRPSSASLDFPGEPRLPLHFAGGRWAGERAFTRSALYRIDATGLPRQRLHRLEVMADAAPIVRVVAPDSQLAMVRPGQARWTPMFEASDDYGLEASATLRVIVTKGEGENVTTTERSMSLSGQGDARRKRYSTTLDLAREGMAPGSDLIVQLVVSDNRAPGRHKVEGPSVILRWPADLALADGLDGMMRQVMPAYFRSQRQIIIDAEALIAQRSRIASDRFVDRSNALGGDQAQLRLRYGQFMGEEDKGGGGLSLPTNDAPGALDLPTNDAPSPATKSAEQDDHGHDDHADTAAPSTFGQMSDVVAQYGHAHDSGDAATLFDPGTRSTLAQALDAMWSSERALRQGKPQEALPHAHRALDLLKTAQQATRIFLARTSPKLPPIDLSRRLTGKREGIAAGALTPITQTPADVPAAEAWRALAETPAAAPVRLDALERWVGANRARLTDPLALSAAIDTVRNEPACLDCRRRLRALLWGALDRPTGGVQRREPPSARGRRYLDALR